MVPIFVAIMAWAFITYSSLKGLNMYGGWIYLSLFIGLALSVIVYAVVNLF